MKTGLSTPHQEKLLLPFNIDSKISELNKLIDEILIEHEESKQISQALIEKTERFQKSIEDFFEKNSMPLNEHHVNKLTVICRKANENENFQFLLYYLKIHYNHPKIFFKKLDKYEEILGDEDYLDTSFDEIIPKKHEEIKKKNSILNVNNNKKIEVKMEIPAKIIELDKNAHLMNEVKGWINESQFHFKQEHNIDKPFKLLQKFNTMMEKYELDPKLGKFFNQMQEENASHFAEVKKEYEYLNFLLKETDAKDWIHEKTKGKIHVYYKLPKGTPTCSLKFEAELECPLKNLASIIYECDLMHTWMPFCKISKTIKKINKACKAFHNEMDLPFICNREAYLVGYAINRLEENGTILIAARTIDQDTEFQVKNDVSIPLKSKHVRMDINYFITEVTPFNENHIKVKMIANMNPKLKIIPYSVINFISRKFGITIFETLIKKATKNFEKSPWYALMFKEENQDFYKWLETSILPFLKKV